MKKFIIIMTLSLMISPFNLFGNSTNDESSIPITVVSVQGNRPRSVIGFPVECYYQNGYVYLNFSENVGNVQVYVYNSATGSTYYNADDSRCGSLSVDVPRSSGNYLVVIITESFMLYGYYSIS